MDTLTAARQKAVDISSTVATMKKPSDIIQHVDELLEILTGDKVFQNVPHFQQNPTPPPLPPTPKNVILLHLKKNKTAMTIPRISKETGLDKETAQSAIDELLAQDKITSPKMRGRKQYAFIEYAHLL